MSFENIHRACMQKAAALSKKAGPYSDIAYGAIPGAALGAISPALAQAVSLGGTIHGAVQPTPTEAEEAQLDKEPLLSMAPGVAASRVMRRLKRQNRADDGSQRHTWAQQFGPLTSTLLAAGAGAGIGAGAGALAGAGQRPEAAGTGALIGAGIGAGGSLAAHLLGAGLAGLTPTRTRAEQRAYANSDAAGEWIVPGLAAYNVYKSYGRSHADANEREEKEQAKAKKAEGKKDTKTASAHQLTAYDILTDIAARGLHKKAGWREDLIKESVRPVARAADEAYRAGQQDALTANGDYAMTKNMWGGLGIGAAAGGTLAGLLADRKSSPARKLAQILAGAGLGGVAGTGLGMVRGFMDQSRLSAAPYEKALDEQGK
jgi:hypothetical protein